MDRTVIRKTLSLGPFSVSFSRSGISVSVGAGGIRLGVSPRGKFYFSWGKGGLQYRKTLGGACGSEREKRRPSRKG